MGQVLILNVFVSNCFLKRRIERKRKKIENIFKACLFVCCGLTVCITITGVLAVYNTSAFKKQHACMPLIKP